MNANTEIPTKPDYQALQDELERRYGPALAQDIVEQIRKVEEPSFVPGYIAVKAASEVLELFREEAKASLREIKVLRAEAVADTENVVFLEPARKHQECERALGLYFQGQRGFYRLYRKALAAYTEEAPASRKYRKVHEPETASVSTAA